MHIYEALLDGSNRMILCHLRFNTYKVDPTSVTDRDTDLMGRQRMLTFNNFPPKIALMYANTDLSRPILCLMSEPRLSKIAGTAETIYKELVG
jgi:hypothetical protein